MIKRKTFNSDWFKSEEGQSKFYRVHSEGMSFETSLSELELWCKGWISQNKQENHNPLKLAKQVICVNI